jgi:peroxiredoxin family protein
MQTAAKFIDTSDLWMKGRSWAISKKWGWMASIATGMMKGKIDKANIPSLADLQEMAQIEGVEVVACKMTVDMMEIDEKSSSQGWWYGRRKISSNRPVNARFACLREN